jgi:hypothetical protein
MVVMGREEVSKSPDLGGSILYKSIDPRKARVQDGGEEELIPEEELEKVKTKKGNEKVILKAVVMEGESHD